MLVYTFFLWDEVEELTLVGGGLQGGISARIGEQCWETRPGFSNLGLVKLRATNGLASTQSHSLSYDDNSLDVPRPESCSIF